MIRKRLNGTGPSRTPVLLRSAGFALLATLVLPAAATAQQVPGQPVPPAPIRQAPPPPQPPGQQPPAPQSSAQPAASPACARLQGQLAAFDQGNGNAARADQ